MVSFKGAIISFPPGIGTSKAQSANNDLMEQLKAAQCLGSCKEAIFGELEISGCFQK